MTCRRSWTRWMLEAEQQQMLAVLLLLLLPQQLYHHCHFLLWFSLPAAASLSMSRLFSLSFSLAVSYYPFLPCSPHYCCGYTPVIYRQRVSISCFAALCFFVFANSSPLLMQRKLHFMQCSKNSGSVQKDNITSWWNWAQQIVWRKPGFNTSFCMC